MKDLTPRYGVNRDMVLLRVSGYVGFGKILAVIATTEFKKMVL
jgi:hypothetical protein